MDTALPSVISPECGFGIRNERPYTTVTKILEVSVDGNNPVIILLEVRRSCRDHTPSTKHPYVPPVHRVGA